MIRRGHLRLTDAARVMRRMRETGRSRNQKNKDQRSVMSNAADMSRGGLGTHATMQMNLENITVS